MMYNDPPEERTARQKYRFWPGDGCPAQGWDAAGSLLRQLAFGNMHYLEAGAALVTLNQRHGLTRHELAQYLGLPAQTIVDRMALAALEMPLQQRIRASAMPERTAQALLQLPDEATREQAVLRILQEQLGVRDALLLIASIGRSGRNCAISAEKTAAPKEKGRVISLARDHRLYLNAIRGVVRQMQDTGLRATIMETRRCGCVEVRVTLPTRSRRAWRRQSSM